MTAVVLCFVVGIILLALEIVVPGAVLGIAGGIAMLAGVAIFCGLLYVIALGGPGLRWLGRIVPIGGVSLIVSWLLLAIGALKR